MTRIEHLETSTHTTFDMTVDEYEKDNLWRWATSQWGWKIALAVTINNGQMVRVTYLKP